MLNRDLGISVRALQVQVSVVYFQKTSQVEFSSTFRGASFDSCVALSIDRSVSVTSLLSCHILAYIAEQLANLFIETYLLPFTIIFHNFSGSVASPGKRPAIPIIAMGIVASSSIEAASKAWLGVPLEPFAEPMSLPLV